MVKFMYYINYFFFYSIFGHIMESIVYLFFKGESGILFCPWTPVYGFGAVIVIFFSKMIDKKIDNKIYRNIFYFIVNFLILNILEYIAGNLIEKIFGIIFWTYKDFKFNLGNYISLEIGIIWGLLSLVIVHLVPLTDKIIKKIPRFISWLFIVLMIIDSLLTIFFR